MSFFNEGKNMDISGDGNLWLDLGIFAALMAASGFFSCAETALTGASRARMQALESDGDARARLVNRLRERKDTLISALLFGNTIVNVFSSAFATSVVIRIFGDRGIVYATLGVTLAVFIFAEVMPKTYALMHPDRIALFMARPVAIVVAVFSPVIGTVSKFVRLMLRLLRVGKVNDSSAAQEEELRGAITLFKDAVDVGADQEKGAMLRSILDLADVKVEEIMVHRKNVRMINADWPVEKTVDEVLHSTFTRLPVWRESADNIVGIIHAKLLLNELRQCGGDVARMNIGNAMMEPWFIPESTTLFDQLQAFRRRREHFAVMVDEYGVLKGVITLEDILEEIVGQIDDEHDVAVSGIHPQPDGSYVIDGKVTIRDLNRNMDWDLPTDDYSTIAGLLLHETQRIPGLGQVFTFHGFSFEVQKKHRNQITSVRITPPSGSMTEQGAAYDTGA